MILRPNKFDKLSLNFSLSSSVNFQEAVQWLMCGRLGLLYLFLSITVLHQVFQKSLTSPIVYWLLASCFLFGLIQALTIPKLPEVWWVAAFTILFDAAIVSLWIHHSNGKDSLFVVLYLIQILLVSLVLYQWGALFTSLVAVLFFGIVMAVSEQPSRFITWSVYSGLFIVLGVVGGYLSEELLQTTQRLKEKSTKMEKLMAQHERILNEMPTGLLTVDSQMRVQFLNPAAEHILGKFSNDIIGKNLAVVEPGLLPFFTQIKSEKLSNEGQESETVSASTNHSNEHRTYFVQNRDKKGTRLQQTVEMNPHRLLRGDVATIDISAGFGPLIGSESTAGKVLLFQDVTTLMHLEEKLRQNEKLAAVGQLAAGIAHEIRNPLASMSASIEMLKGSAPGEISSQENQKLMDIAIREIDRLNRLITEFLNFVRPEKFRFEKVMLKDLLAELVLSGKRVPSIHSVNFVETYDSQVHALANGEKLKQVVWNLIINAIQAMVKPGKIEIGCASVSEQRVKFWVEDQGNGMTEQVLAHLYEPFFTTKDRGTGLGLATAYKIVEAHQGEITVSSGVGTGTRFEVFLQKA